MISACVFGYGKLAQEFVKSYKLKEYYKNEDGDITKCRVHIVQVLDHKAEEYADVTMTYYKEPNGYLNCLADGDEGTSREVSFGDHAEWLAETNGHDTVFELTEGDEGYMDMLLTQIKKGYWTVITSQNFYDNHKGALDSAAEESGAKLEYIFDIEELLVRMDEEYKIRLDRHLEIEARERAYLSEGEPCGLGEFNW